MKWNFKFYINALCLLKNDAEMIVGMTIGTVKQKINRNGRDNENELSQGFPLTFTIFFWNLQKKIKIVTFSISNSYNLKIF